MTEFHRVSMTPELYNEACNLMALGYSARHAAYVVNIHVSQLANAIIGAGTEEAIELLERDCRETRVARIKGHLEAYPNTSLFPILEAAA